MALGRPARFEVLDASPDALGEGPWWSVADQRLWWVDILGHTVRSADLNAADLREWTTDTEVGFVVPDTAGGIVLGLKPGLARLDLATGAVAAGVTVEPRTDYRLNDGKTDRAGRLWFGAMHVTETDPTAGLYRVDAAGTWQIFDTIVTSNGLGWSPDNTTMYYTDSISQQIRAFDFDPATGTMTNPRVFAEDPRGGYVPDGLTVDADGCVWGAKWGGSRVVRYAPDGRVLADLRFPVARMTSCMFVGPRLDTLAITSAQGGAPNEPLAGRVFLIDPGTTGVPETPVPADVWATALHAAGPRPEETHH